MGDMSKPLTVVSDLIGEVKQLQAQIDIDFKGIVSSDKVLGGNGSEKVRQEQTELLTRAFAFIGETRWHKKHSLRPTIVGVPSTPKGAEQPAYLAIMNNLICEVLSLQTEHRCLCDVFLPATAVGREEAKKRQQIRDRVVMQAFAIIGEAEWNSESAAGRSSDSNEQGTKRKAVETPNRESVEIGGQEELRSYGFSSPSKSPFPKKRIITATEEDMQKPTATPMKLSQSSNFPNSSQSSTGNASRVNATTPSGKPSRSHYGQSRGIAPVIVLLDRISSGRTDPHVLVPWSVPAGATPNLGKELVELVRPYAPQLVGYDHDSQAYCLVFQNSIPAKSCGRKLVRELAGTLFHGRRLEFLGNYLT